MELRYDDLDNLFSATLTTAIDDNDTTIYLSSAPTKAGEGFLVLDPDNSSKREVIYFNTVGSNYVSCPSSDGRGQAGTSAVSHDSGATVKMYLLREHIVPLRDFTVFGWIKTNASATYVSATEFKLSGDFSSKIQKGDKIKLTNSSVKYFYVTDVSYSSPDTTIKVSPLAGSSSLASGTITDVNFSKVYTPQGVPKKRIWAQVKTSGMTLTAQGTATLTATDDTTFTVINPNANGFKGAAGAWAIIGGFYFTPDEDMTVEVSSDIGIRISDGESNNCYLRLTKDTTAPAQNDDSTSDGGTDFGAIKQQSLDASSWNDHASLSNSAVTSLSANTTYYFTAQIKWYNGSAAAPDTMSLDMGMLILKRLD